MTLSYFHRRQWDGGIRMDLRAVKVFVLAAKTLNFTRVAELLYTSPSSVSKYINQLEGEVGQPLFIRDTRRVELSEYGKALLPYAEKLWREDQEMERFISLHSDTKEMMTLIFGLSADIRVSPPISKFATILRAFSNFHAQYPHAFLTLRNMPESELAKAVAGGSLHFALAWDQYFADNKSLQEKLSFFRIMREKRYLMFSPRLYSGVQSIKDLYWQVDKIIYAENIQSSQSAHHLARQFFGDATLFPCDTWSEEFLRVIAEEGAGFIEESLVELATSTGLQCLQLGEQDYGQDLCIVWNRDSKHPELQKMIACLQEEFGRPAEK